MANVFSGASGRRVALVILASTLVLGLAYAGLRAGASDPLVDLAAVIGPTTFGERVLIIAPHPDDETLAPGGLVSELRAGGASVRAVVLTSGDGFKRAASLLTTGPLTPEVYRELGRLRHAESDAALASFDVPPADRLFLCYPDGSLNTLWDRDWDAARPHLGANGATAAPYDYAWRRGTVYCGADMASDLETILTQYRPTSVVYPDPADTHHDHWAAAAFTEYAMAATGYRGGRYTYLVHFGQYPFPWAYLPNAYLRPPTELTEVGTRWFSLPLDESAESAKSRAIALFRSQLRLSHMNVYLRAFIRRNELYGTYEPPAPLYAELDPDPPTSPEAQDIVIREPRRSGFASLLGQPGTVAAVRMVRGPRMLWMGISTHDGSPPELRYVYNLRLFGGGAPSRLDVTVNGTTAQASNVATNSVVPTDLRVVRSGGTVWVGLPSELYEGRNECLVSGGAFPKRARGKGYRSAWRPVRL